MNAANEICAKIMGNILAEGMSLSDFDVSEEVKTEATKALEEIRAIMYKDSDEHKKLRSIKGIMDRYNIKRMDKKQ